MFQTLLGDTDYANGRSWMIDYPRLGLGPRDSQSREALKFTGIDLFPATRTIAS